MSQISKSGAASTVIGSLSAFCNSVVGFSPPQISDLVLWLDATNVNGNNTNPPTGTAISSWIDLSIQHNNASQASGGDQPLFETNVQNSLPGVQFNGTTMNMLGTIPTLPTDPNITVCCACINTATTPTSAFFGVGSVDAVPESIGFAKNFSADYFNVFTWGGVEARYSPDTSNPIVFVGGRDVTSENNFIFINGVAGFSTGGSDFPSVNTTYTVGSHSNVDFPFYLQGYVLELIVYLKVLSPTERTAIDNYLSTKWGITL